MPYGDEFGSRSPEPAVAQISPPDSFVEQANVTDSDIRRRFDESGPAAWRVAGEQLDWDRSFDQVYDEEENDWFPGGKLNASVNCVDRHLTERKNQRALVWEGQLGETRSYTYLELHREVTEFAAALGDLGVEAGDIVTLHMPAIPELPIAMLACARIGAPHAVVYAGFSADALETRMERSESSYLVVSDGYYRRGDAVSLTNKAETVKASLDQEVTTVVVDRFDDHSYTLGEQEYEYRALLADHEGEGVEPVSREATDELFVIYTSGTTGKPKRVTHTTGGYLSHVAWTSHAVLDLKPRDTHLCTADIGWITGHSYVVYGPLALGTTVLLREGEADQPPKSKLWELIETHAVDVLYTSPTAIRTFRKWGVSALDGHDLSSLRLIGTVGEPINPGSWEWFYEHVGGEDCAVVDTWWQTETGAHLISTLPAIDEMKPGMTGPTLPGIQATVVDGEGTAVADTEGGYLVIDSPWPGMPLELSEGDRWASPDDVHIRNPWRYRTGDGARRDEDGYYTILGRVDDVINVSGHRLGTKELESAVVSVDDIAEAAVVGGTYNDHDHGIFVYAIREDDGSETEKLRAAIRRAIEQQIGSFARPTTIIFSPELPKTSSGKIVRRLLSDIANGQEIGDTSALRNPEVVGELASESDWL